MQQAKAGLEAKIPLGLASGRCGNTSETMYPDQSLYATTRCPPWFAASTTPSSAPTKSSGAVASTLATKEFIDYFLPIVADAEAGFGGVLNAFELMKNMIAAGALAFTLKTSWLP